MARAKCCSKRSVQLKKINKIKAVKAANTQRGTPKKASTKKAKPMKGKPCRACKKARAA